MLSKGNSSVIDVKKGSTQINSVYKGSSLVWANLDNIVNNVTLKASGNSSSSYTLTCDKKGLYAVILCNHSSMSRDATSSIATSGGTIVGNYAGGGARVALINCNVGNTITKSGSGNQYNYYYIWYIGNLSTCTIVSSKGVNQDVGTTSGSLAINKNQIGLFMASLPSNNFGRWTSISITLTNAKTYKNLINNNGVGFYVFNANSSVSIPWSTYNNGDYSHMACLTAVCSM